MEHDDTYPSEKDSRPGLGKSCLLLTIIVLAVFPLFAWFGYSRHAMDGVFAASIAGGVCWLGATLALVTTVLLQGSPSAVSGTLLGTAFRTGLPFLSAFALAQMGGPIAKAGVVGMIVAYYLLTLVAETLLAVRLIKPIPQTSKGL